MEKQKYCNKISELKINYVCVCARACLWSRKCFVRAEEAHTSFWTHRVSVNPLKASFSGQISEY